MNPYHRFVGDLSKLVKKAARAPSAQFKTNRRHTPQASAPKALIFSPHPDDECIVGGLPLRLLRQAKWNVLNVAVTLGSDKQRRIARVRELTNACSHLGFGLIVPRRKGLDHITPSTPRKNPEYWTEAVNVVRHILQDCQPRAIFLPHELDGHSTHSGTHLLVMDALRTMPSPFQCFVVETEYWAPMQKPNLLVEVRANDLGDLVTALSCHTGEVKRNPYHLRLPAWMMDNVRRAEAVAGHGAAAPQFSFATIYRLHQWKHGRFVNTLRHGKFLSSSENAGLLFK